MADCKSSGNTYFEVKDAGDEDIKSLKQEGNPSKKATDQTKYRVRTLADLIVKGYTERRLKEFIEDNFNIHSDTMLKTYIQAAYNYLTPDNPSEWLEELRKQNFERLAKIYEEAKNAGKQKEAIMALQEMDKMGNFYKESMEVKIQGDIHFKFGGEEE